MNNLYIIILKILRKIYTRTFNTKINKPSCEQDAEMAFSIIYNRLLSEKPCMVARLGSTELACLCNYIGVKESNKNIFKFVRGYSNPWWWETTIINQMKNWSGFFPANIGKINQFSQLMLNDMEEVDILGSWLNNEIFFNESLSKSVKITFELLNPYFSKCPWTKALEGKKVLVVHPFSETIQQQYLKRELLFKNNLLPQFELITIKAVQSLAGNATEFNDWFEALNYMKSEIDKVDYDICLIGAGAYGFPLAAHVKRMGKKSIQLGGSLQLLFGIKGARWENPNYNPIYNYAALMNEHWVRPNEKEKPINADVVEGACYW